MPATPIRLLIVAVDPLARAGLAGMLDGVREVAVTGMAAPDDDLTGAIAVFRPDLLLWDLGWSADSGFEQIAEWVQDGEDAPGPALLVLVPNAEAGRTAWQAGARALLLRSVALPRLLAGVTAAVEGLVVVAPELSELVGRASAASGETLGEPLTPRELEVLQWVAQGLPNKTIARQLQISEHTVKFHVNSLLGKLGAQSRTDAVVRASRAGLVLL